MLRHTQIRDSLTRATRQANDPSLPANLREQARLVANLARAALKSQARTKELAPKDPPKA